jgi:lipoate-protein ligase A
MRTLDFLVQPRLLPEISLAEDAHFLQVVTHPSRLRTGVLRVYDVPGDIVSLGRYHVAPAEKIPDDGPRLCRRHSGGRVVPFGDGFVGVALALPYRSALLSADPLALAPHQVLNRYVRGILEACKLAGAEAFYPGRDFITVSRRVIGLVSFETHRSGAMLFEAILAVRRDFSLLPALLEAVDRNGVVKAEMLMPHDTTCLERELRRPLSTEEVGELLRRGYEKQFNLSLEPYTLTAIEEQAIHATATHEFRGDRWLRQRQLRPGLHRHAWTRVQLGTFEAYFGLEQERFIRDIMFVGDFIANSPAVERLEQELRLCPVERRAIEAVVSEIFAQPGNYILGIGHVRTIADTITKAMAP